MYLTQGFHRSLQQLPDRPATIFGGRVRTFREQAERVSRLAGALRGLGVRAGERVAILARNSDRYVESLLAVAWANGVFNPVDVRWSTRETARSLKDCRTRILLVDDAFAERLPELRVGYPDLRTAVYMGEGAPPAGMLDGEELILDSPPVPDARRGGAALAGIFYTGGATGSPKGVMLSHAALLTSALGLRSAGGLARPGGRALVAAPLCHLPAFIAWAEQLMVGGTQVVLPAFDPVAVLEAVERHRVDFVALAPSMIEQVVDHPAAAGHDLSSVRGVLYGGSPIGESRLRRAMRALPAASFTQVYAMTELGAVATVLGPEDHRAGRRLDSGGRAAAHVEVRIVDADDRQVPPGAVGEVACRAGNMMLGYWNEPAATALALRGGWLHTGDAGYLDDDGYLFIVGRLKDTITTGGENGRTRLPAGPQCASV